jgi:hypothetical protein
VQAELREAELIDNGALLPNARNTRRIKVLDAKHENYKTNPFHYFSESSKAASLRELF